MAQAKERFKVGDEVTMIKYNGDPSGNDFPEFIGKQGTIVEDRGGTWQPYIVRFTNGGNLWLWHSDLKIVKEEAKDTVKFKVGDEVKVKSLNTNGCSAPKDTIGKYGKIFEHGCFKEFGVKFKVGICGDDQWYYDSDELELAKATTMSSAATTAYMDYKAALKLAIDGTAVRPVDFVGKHAHIEFIDGRFMYVDGDRAPVYNEGYIHKDVQWEVYVAPPKFTVNSLVYNTDGTIGRIIEDRGSRKYGVEFNAVRDTLKTVDESELTEYVL